MRGTGWQRAALGLAVILIHGCSPEADTVAPESGGAMPAGSASTPQPAPADTAAEPSFRFADRTGESGLVFEYRNDQGAGNSSILESLGGGVAAIDLDGDLREDLCFGGGGHYEGQQILPKSTGLFRARGNWSWQDVSDVTGVATNRFYSHGIARTDYDNDGFPDLSVTGYGGVDVYRNLGDGTFERLDESTCGLIDPHWSSSAAWADLNSDSHPDCHVAHYVNWSWDNHPFCNGPEAGSREVCPPRSYAGLTDAVFFSNGDGTFRNATAEAGLTTEGKGLGVVIGDLDLDNDNDVYVTNDTVPNFLYQNDGHGEFSDVSLLSGASLSDRGVPEGSMGVDVFDSNGDGQPDLWVVNYERETSALYQNSGSMSFRHVSQRTGINAVGGLFVGWGTNCQDFDLDGDEDMFVSNGHVIRYPVNAPLDQNPLLFENLGGRFRNAAPSAGPYFLKSHMGRGSSAADLDGDGDADLAISRTNQPVVVLENSTPASGRHLIVSVFGRSAAREPIGTSVQLIAGAVSQTRFIHSGGSYSSSSTSRILFGCKDASASPALEVKWPSGRVDRMDSIPDSGHVGIVEPAGEQPLRVVSLP